MLRQWSRSSGHRSERLNADRESDQPSGGDAAVAVGAGAASGCGCTCQIFRRCSGGMIKIELTVEQANTLLQLIDIAIKAGGFQNAKVGVPLAEIILEAAKSQVKSE